MKTLLFCSVSLLLLVHHASAALKVGSPAPKLSPGKWAQGEAVQAFEGDKVYLIEFWATWCGPCVAVIPHLNDLQRKHREKGLVVIGQNLGEDQATVKAFVSKMGSKMSYRVTTDNEQGSMGKNWLEAAGQNGIPCAFVVNKKGRIAYIGHPMNMDESLLTKLLAEPSEKPEQEAVVGQPEVPSPLALSLKAKAVAELDAGKQDEAETTIATLYDELPETLAHMAAVLELRLMTTRGQVDDAVEFSKVLAEDSANHSEILNQIASALVSTPKPDSKLQTAAVAIATPISTQEGPNRSGALATLARIAFQQGEKARAIELQQQSAASANGAEAETAKTVLEAYQQDRLP